MIAKLLEKLTGTDDVERIACKQDARLLNEYLQTRRLLFPKRPLQFLDAATLTQEQLSSLTTQEATELAGERIELWVLETDGKRRLPAFSSQKKMEIFSATVSRQLTKVFALGCVEALLSEATRDLDIDLIDLNLFSKQ